MTINIEDHFSRLLKLLELEREAEKEENKRGLERHTLAVRETLGKTVTRLSIIDEDIGTGGIPLLILSKATVTGQNIVREGLSPFHSMNQGDNVLLTFPMGTGLDPIDGTLYDVSEFQVTVALGKPAPDPLPRGLCQLDLLGSDATYKRMRQALGQIHRTGKEELVHLRDVSLGLRKPDKNSVPPLELHNPGLNKFQVEAVHRTLEAEEVAIIHGPPGTGKTTVLVEIILQLVKDRKRVLASAPSNISVDNIVEKLLPYGLRIVRVGHPARVMEELHHVTLAAQQEEHAGQREIKMMDDERHRMINQMRRKQDRGSGASYTERIEMKSYIEQLWKTARDQEFAIRREIIRNAQVVLTTHGSVGGILAKERFDVVVMDEASQATEPLSWVPLTLGKKAIFAGDSNQLPPTLYSKEAAEQGLSITLFDRLKENLPETHQSLLRVQYRMHEAIMGFSSRHFYENKLIADESVRHHTLKDLKGVHESDLFEPALRYIDTVGTGYEEEWNELLESRENDGEAQLVLKVLKKIQDAGVQGRHIGILSPYVAQVKKLKLLMIDHDIEIGSIDSFQGREKECIILSLVRSNEKGEVGFLSDTRRMNVGMTRAKRLLIVIGDSATIGRHPFYAKFLEYVEEAGQHESAWDWINEQIV